MHEIARLTKFPLFQRGIKGGFRSLGTHSIAVKAIDNEGLEAVEVVRVKVVE